MADSKQNIVQAIKNYITQCDGSYPDWSTWYVGIASNPSERLFEKHKVDRENGNWIYQTAESSLEAREVESHFVNDLKADGGTGGGDYSTRAVYAHKKTGYTVETA